MRFATSGNLRTVNICEFNHADKYPVMRPSRCRRVYLPGKTGCAQVVLTFWFLVSRAANLVQFSQGSALKGFGLSWAVSFCGLWLVLFSWKMLALLTLACCASFLSSWQSAGPAVLLWFVQSFLQVLSLQFMSLSVLSYIILGNFRNSGKCHRAIRERLRLWAGPLEPHTLGNAELQHQSAIGWEAKGCPRAPLTPYPSPQIPGQIATVKIHLPSWSMCFPTD